MAEINEFLSSKAEQQIKEYIKVLGKMNTEYSSIATSLDKLNSKSRSQEKSETKLTNLEKERIRVAQQTKKVFAQNLAAEEKATKTLILGQERLKIARKKSREEAQKQLGVIKKSNGLFRSMAKSMLAAGAAMVSIQAVFRIFGSSIKTIANFEQAMDKVAAVTRALPADFKALTANAKLLGETTSRSASQVAGLQLEFAKLGFSTKEILAATEATIQLSIAAGSDLAESAVVAASTVRGFGLSADETQRVVDVMAKSFASSALDLEKFKTSMSAVAPVAKANGKNIEFVTARLSVLTDAGLDASTSGTSLRNMFLNLSKEGLTWEEGLEKINSATDKNVAALDLFGKRGATAALILADNIKKAEGLEKSYKGAAGSAEEMARIMEDNLIGDTKKLSSAWEGWILSSSKGITNLGRALVQLATGALNLLNKKTEERIDLTRLDNKQMNISFNALKDVNLSQDARLKLISKINTQYGDYLPNLLTEQSSIEDITKAQDAANKAFRVKIIQQAFEEEMTEVIKKEAAAYEALAESQIAAAEDAQKIATTDTEAKLLDQSKAISKLGETYAKTVIDNNEKEVESTRNKFKKIAELYNIAFSEIENALMESTEVVETEDEKQIDSAKNKQLALKGIEQEANIVVTESEDEKYKLVREGIAKTIAANKEKLKQIEADEKESEENKKRIRDEFISAAQETGNILFDLGQAQRDRELEGLEEGSARRKELLAEQARSERNQALFNVAVNAAQGIIKTIGNVGMPLAIPLIAIQSAIAATQTAAILSQPLPAFFAGTDNAPSTFIAGDKYGRELIAKKDGSVELSPDQATIYSGNEYKGASIIPNSQTENILRGSGNGSDTRMLNELRLTRKAIENSTPNIRFSRNVGRLNTKHLNRKYGN